MLSKPTLRAWTPVFFWLALVAWESTWLFASSETGKLLRPLLTFLLGPMSDARFYFLHGLLRKCGHFFLYSVLSLLSFRAWWITLHPHTAGHSWRKMLARWSFPSAFLASLITLAVATLDEFHQAFLGNRTGTIRDVLLDTAGALFVQFMLLACSRGLEVGAVRPPSTLAGAPVQRQEHQG